MKRRIWNVQRRRKLTSLTDPEEHHWRAWGQASGSVIVESLTASKRMVDLGRPICTHSYNGVCWSAWYTCKKEGDISFFRHFWHVVDAVALDGPPPAGPLPYRFMSKCARKLQFLHNTYQCRKLAGQNNQWRRRSWGHAASCSDISREVFLVRGDGVSAKLSETIWRMVLCELFASTTQGLNLFILPRHPHNAFALLLPTLPHLLLVTKKKGDILERL